MVAYLFPRSAHVITITFGRQYPLNGMTACIRPWSLHTLPSDVPVQSYPPPTALYSATTQCPSLYCHIMRHGLPTGLLPQNIPPSTLLRILVLSVWTTWPAYCNLLNLIYFTTSGPSNNSFSSSLCLSLHLDLFLQIGPKILLSIFLSNYCQLHCPCLAATAQYWLNRSLVYSEFFFSTFWS